MLSGISSYLFGSALPAENQEESSMQEEVLNKHDDHDRLLTREEDEEWILVDKAKREALSPHCSHFRTPQAMSPCNSSGRSTPVHVTHPSLCESWLVTPPPCFTADGSAQSDPLENLLIEHPSMSVYSLRGRTHSTGADSEGSSSAPEDNQPSQRAVYRSSRPHLTLNTAKNSKVATRSMQKAVKRSEHQHLSRNHMQRSNRVQKHNNQCRRPRRSDRMMQPSGRSNNRSMH